MGGGGSGTLYNGGWICGSANRFRFPKRFWFPFPPIPFLMANFGIPFFCILLLRFVDTPGYRRFGRDNFQEAMKLGQRTAASSIDWMKFKYMVYDIPNHKGTFGERYAALGIS